MAELRRRDKMLGLGSLGMGTKVLTQVSSQDTMSEARNSMNGSAPGLEGSRLEAASRVTCMAQLLGPQLGRQTR